MSHLAPEGPGLNGRSVNSCYAIIFFFFTRESLSVLSGFLNLFCAHLTGSKRASLNPCSLCIQRHVHWSINAATECRGPRAFSLERFMRGSVKKNKSPLFNSITARNFERTTPPRARTKWAKAAHPVKELLHTPVHPSLNRSVFHSDIKGTSHPHAA